MLEMNYSSAEAKILQFFTMLTEIIPQTKESQSSYCFRSD